MMQNKILIEKPIGEKLQNLEKCYYLSESTDNVQILVDVDTAFNYLEKDGDLELSVVIPKLGINIYHSVWMNPRDKIAILNFINKDNNRIKSQIEEMEHMLKQDVRTCRFCNNTDIEKFMPRDEDTAINLCPQHQKYIQRISERINGGV